MKKKSQNTNLHKAKKVKNDEFYTQLADIEKELNHYKEHFKNKVVYCNCDDPRVSNFFKYFSYRFKELGLKKLITTCYKSKDIESFNKKESTQASCLVYDGFRDGESVPNPDDIGICDLKGDGDFRNKESIELLKEADIVVTNPPFSLFRECVAQLIEYDKKFLIVGNMNAVGYKEIFKLIEEKKLWTGCSIPNMFKIPNGTMKKMSLCRWFTNLSHDKLNKEIPVYQKYNPEDYPKYDNYDAINVDRVKDIPCGYKGTMGVPISFMDKHNPKQFKIVKFRKGDDEKDLSINGKYPYFRILIKSIK